MNTIKNLPLQYKIVGLSVIVLLMIGVIILFSKMENYAIHNLETVREIEVNMLQARRSEKDFLMRKDLSYAGKFDTAIVGIIDQLEELSEKETASQINSAINTYRKSFKAIVAKLVERGLNEESGAEGDLRDKVHTIEAIVDKTNKKLLAIDMLMARRSEKDFFMRKADKYVDKVDKAIGLLKEHTEWAGLPSKTI